MAEDGSTKPRSPFDVLKDMPETIQDDQVAELEKALTAEKDARREERFLFIFILIILINFVLFNASENWGAPVTLMILELLFLAFLAKRMGMEEVATLLDGVIGRVAKTISSKDD